MRGGSWYNNNADKLLAAYRNNNKPENQNNNIGFRVAEHLIKPESASLRICGARKLSPRLIPVPVKSGQIKIAWFWPVN
jgi:hypothetical protein